MSFKNWRNNDDYEAETLKVSISVLECLLEDAEKALAHCILSTGGYTGGEPQKYFEETGRPMPKIEEAK